jgi:hypothetical protein
MSADSSTENPSAAPDAASAETAIERPSQRIQIGSQRDTDPESEKPQPKPIMPVKTAQPKKEQKHYPPPNIRDQLSPELEAEYLAAVGEASFDNLMQAATAGGATARAWCRCGSSKRRRPRALRSSWWLPASTPKKASTN